MADFKLTADDSEVIAALDNIEKRLASAGAAATDLGKKVDVAMSGTDADAKRAAASLAEYTAAQEKLKAGTQDRINTNAKMRAGLEQFRKEQAALNTVTDEGAKKNVEFGAAVKETTGGLNAGAAAAKNAEGATKGATLAQRAFNLVMSLNPIGLIIAALAILVNQLRKYQGVIDFASKITAQIGAVFTVVTDRAISLGKAIYSLVTLDWAGFGKNSMDAIDGFGESVSNAWEQAGNLADATVQLRDAQLAAALSTAKLQAASEKAQAAAQDESKTYNERIILLRKAIAIEAEIARVKVGFAEQDAQNARNAFALSNGNVAAKEALLEKELALQETRNGADKTRIGLLQQLNALEKQRIEFITKSVEDVKKLVDKLDVDLQDDPIEKAMEQVRQRIEGQIVAIEEAQAKLKEVEKLRPLNEEEIKLRQDLQDKTVEVIEDGEKAIADALLEGLKKQSDIDNKKKEAAKAAAEERNDDARKLLKEALELENAKISITEAEFSNLIATLKAQGAKEQDIKNAQFEFGKRINAEKLEAELSYNKALLKLATPGTEADIIKARIQELQTLLEGIDIPAPKSKGDKGPLSLFDLLGIKFDDPEVEANIKASINSIIDSLGELAQARVDEAEAATEAAQKKVDAAEDALKKEEDFAKQGLANNTDIRKQELARAKEARDIALKEEEKAKKQQIALDSAVQLSSLITTAANIFKGFSTLPIVGQVLGVISVAAMFASFAAAKANALKAASAPKLRKGRKFDGPTHEQGNEDMVFDGLRAYAVEKDEWLIGTEHSREHDTFLGNLNRGKYKGMNLAAMAERKGDYESPLSEAAPRVERLAKRREMAQEAQHFNVLAKTYERVGDRIVSAVNGQPVVLPWKDGYQLITKEGSITTKKTVTPQS